LGYTSISESSKFIDSAGRGGASLEGSYDGFIVISRRIAKLLVALHLGTSTDHDMEGAVRLTRTTRHRQTHSIPQRSASACPCKPKKPSNKLRAAGRGFQISGRNLRTGRPALAGLMSDRSSACFSEHSRPSLIRPEAAKLCSSSTYLFRRKMLL
jgi:hypothetical protein